MTEPTLEDMQADFMRSRGFGLIEHPWHRYASAEDVVDFNLGPASMQAAAADWLAAHPPLRASLGRRGSGSIWIGPPAHHARREAVR